jgi:two-component system NtrC family response regulator/two-component system response regulator HydG
VQVIVLDPTQEIGTRVEPVLAAAGVGIVSVGSIHALAAPLAAGAADDVLIARVRRDEEGVRLAEYLHHRGFCGRTFLVVDHQDQLGLEQRLNLPRTESLQFSPRLLDALITRLAPAAERDCKSMGRGRSTFHGLVGRSKQILDVFARVEKAAAGDANVCIYGESGTGKELIARAIHAVSDRRNGPLVTFDCTSVPEGLAESQMFGHVRGAFTGAIEHREGVFSQADGGTLFIDELCELSMPLQAKLLRVVQGREFVKVGGTKPIRTNIRLVTATNKDPKLAADAGTFRADLYYRVAVVMIKVPPLRERREDIPLLVEHFLERYSAAYKKPIRGVQPSAMERMMALPWPGNIRQLENFLAQAVVLVEGDMLTERDLFLDDAPSVIAPAPTAQFEPGLPLREVERRHILRTLQRVHGNRTEAAKLLGISVRCLQYKLKAYAQAGDTPTPIPEASQATPAVTPLSSIRQIAAI